MTATRFAAALAAFALAPTLAIAHPLDGLTGAEMLRVTEMLRAAGEANDETRYPLIELIEPPKADVLAWSEGDPEPRRALVHLMNETGFRTAVVDITGGAVESAGPAAGQPMVLFEEFTGAMTAALAHPEMIAGLARRGLTPGDVFCLPLTAGNYLTPEYEGTRLMKVPCYLNPTGSNYYAKPIEGLFAVVDLLRSEATGVVDEGIVPVPEDDWGYTPDEAYEAGYSPVAPVVMTLHVKAAESGLRQARHACSNALAKQSVYFVAISDDQIRGLRPHHRSLGDSPSRHRRQRLPDQDDTKLRWLSPHDRPSDPRQGTAPRDRARQANRIDARDRRVCAEQAG